MCITCIRVLCEMDNYSYNLTDNKNVMELIKKLSLFNIKH